MNVLITPCLNRKAGLARRPAAAKQYVAVKGPEKGMYAWCVRGVRGTEGLHVLARCRPRVHQRTLCRSLRESLVNTHILMSEENRLSQLAT